MGRPLGLAKSGGRKKGIPNRRSSDLVDQLMISGFDPLKEILELLPSLESKDKLRALTDLLPYVYPRRKSVDKVGMNEIEAVLKTAPQDDLRGFKQLIDTLILETDEDARIRKMEITRIWGRRERRERATGRTSATPNDVGTGDSDQ